MGFGDGIGLPGQGRCKLLVILMSTNLGLFVRVIKLQSVRFLVNYCCHHYNKGTEHNTLHTFPALRPGLSVGIDDTNAGVHRHGEWPRFS